MASAMSPGVNRRVEIVEEYGAELRAMLEKLRKLFPSSLSDLNALPGYWVESPDRF